MTMRFFLLITVFFASTFLTFAFCNNDLTVPPTIENNVQVVNSGDYSIPQDSNILSAEIELKGMYRNGNIEFLWTHNTHGQACDYILQRSADSQNFKDISNQKSDGSDVGDIFFDVDTEYRKMDEKKYYRLKVVGKDGKEVFSKIIKV